MSRAEILSHHMELIEKHHVATHNAYLNKPGDRDEAHQRMIQARDAVLDSVEAHGITRAELTDHSKRNTFTAKSVGHAMDHLKAIFG